MSFRAVRSGRAAAGLLGAAVAAAIVAGCASSYRPVSLTEPVLGAGGVLRLRPSRVLLTDDTVESGLGADAALVVELEVRNDGDAPYTLSAASAACVMELDRSRPAETRALLPAGGGEGAFPAGALADEPTLGSVEVPPHGTRAAWLMFHGYELPGSDVPRRVVLSVPDAGGRRVEVDIADPARGALRWAVRPSRVGWTVELQNLSLYAGHLTGMVMGSQISRLTGLGPLMLDLGLVSRLLVQTRGDLMSPTSSFAGSGLAAHLMYPALKWGSAQEPRAIGVYAGGEAQLLIALEAPRAPDDTRPPTFYGAWGIEAGLELDVGTRRPAATPFPLSATAPGLPRWSARVGYVQWWVDHGIAAGFVSSARFAW